MERVESLSTLPTLPAARAKILSLALFNGCLGRNEENMSSEDQGTRVKCA